jgi:hypothetical protein
MQAYAADLYEASDPLDCTVWYSCCIELLTELCAQHDAAMHGCDVQVRGPVRD